MKERIVIDYEDILFSCLHDYEDNVGVINYKFDRRKVEKYPTTWEDLKELCKKLEPKLVKENNLYETQITLNINKGGYYAFYPDGTIIFKASNSINYTIAKNKTMSQMFQFIKSLIGEE